MALAAALPALISAGGSLIGGLLGQDDQEDMARLNIQQQRDFAKHGIKWRVKDAIDAGIHPLYALGAQTASFSPVSIGGSPMGEAVSSMGQDLGRALGATMTGGEKLDAYTMKLRELQLQRGELENYKLGAEIAALNRSTGGPNFPGSPNMIPGQGNAPIMVGGFPVTLSQDWSGAQIFEDRWGEAAGDILGFATGGADLAATLQSNRRNNPESARFEDYLRRTLPPWVQRSIF